MPTSVTISTDEYEVPGHREFVEVSSEEFEVAPAGQVTPPPAPPKKTGSFGVSSSWEPAPPPVAPEVGVGEALMHGLGQGAIGLGRAVTGAPRNIGRVLSGITEAMMPTGVGFAPGPAAADPITGAFDKARAVVEAKAQQEAASDVGQRAAALARAPGRFTDPAYWAGAIGGAIPSTVAALGTAGASKAAQLGTLFGLEASETAGEIEGFEAATGQRVSEPKFAAAVTAAGGVNALLERLGIESVLGAGRVGLRRFLGAMAGEGLTETAQEAVQIGAGRTYDPRAVEGAPGRLATAGGVGAVMGGGFGGAVQAGEALRARRPAVPAPAPEVAVPPAVAAAPPVVEVSADEFEVAPPPAAPPVAEIPPVRVEPPPAQPQAEGAPPPIFKTEPPPRTAPPLVAPPPPPSVGEVELDVPREAAPPPAVEPPPPLAPPAEQVERPVFKKGMVVNVRTGGFGKAVRTEEAIIVETLRIKGRDRARVRFSDGSETFRDLTNLRAAPTPPAAPAEAPLTPEPENRLEISPGDVAIARQAGAPRDLSDPLGKKLSARRNLEVLSDGLEGAKGGVGKFQNAKGEWTGFKSMLPKPLQQNIGYDEIRKIIAKGLSGTGFTRAPKQEAYWRDLESWAIRKDGPLSLDDLNIFLTDHGAPPVGLEEEAAPAPEAPEEQGDVSFDVDELEGRPAPAAVYLPQRDPAQERLERVGEAMRQLNSTRGKEERAALIDDLEPDMAQGLIDRLASSPGGLRANPPLVEALRSRIESERAPIEELSPEASQQQAATEEEDAQRRRAVEAQSQAEPALLVKQTNLFGREDRGRKLDQRDLDLEPEERPSPRGGGGTFGYTPAPRAVPVPAAPGPTLALVPYEEQLRPSEIVAMLSKGFDRLPVKTRHFLERAQGIYKAQPQVIRLKVANDLETLAHEVGHHLDLALIHLDPKIHQKELLPLGKPASRPSYKKAQILREGAAEFTRLYLVDPAEAKLRAPAYYKAFEEGLDRNPEIGPVVRAGQRQVMGYLAQKPFDRVKSKIDFKGADKAKGGDAITRFQVAWIDDLQVLKNVTTELGPINTAQDGYALARLARGAPAKADGFLRFGVRLRNGEKIAEGFEAAIAPVKDRLEDFSTYLVAKHGIERNRAGKPSGIGTKDAIDALEDARAAGFEVAAKKLYAFSDGLLEYARSEGVLTKESIKAMRKLYQSYVPLQRVMDAVESHVAGISKKLANRGSPFKRARGGGQDIINPLESFIRNTHSIVDMVEKNRAMQALVRQAEKTEGGGKFIEEIPTPKEMARFNLSQLDREIKERLDEVGVELPGDFEFDEIVKVFTPAHFVKGEKGIVTVIQNGEPIFYSVNDLALYDAITAIGVKQPEVIINLFERPARMLRAGATLTLGFAARNPVRDTFAAAVNSRYGFKLGWDSMRGLASFLKAEETYQLWLNSGGANSALVSADRNRLREALRRYSKSKTWRDSIVLHPIEALRAISEASETTTRLGEFMRGIEKEGKTVEGLARAGLASRDLIDFAQGGTAAKQINRYTAFFTASIRGLARTVEVFRADPVGATIRATLAITLPSLALFLVNRDDDEYKEIPEFERNTYWHIPLGKGKGFARLPKPFGLLATVFANAPEAFMRFLEEKDPKAFDRVLPGEKGETPFETALNLLISLMPTAIMPAIETVANYDTFRKRAIVSPWDHGLDPELQAGRWTSELAKLVGPKIGLAPAKLDHLIYGYTAGLGRAAVSLLDRPLRALRGEPEKPAMGPRGIPALGAFYRGVPAAEAESLSEFYQRKEQIEGARSSAKHYQEKGEPEKARARAAEQFEGSLYPTLGAEIRAFRVADHRLKVLRAEVDKVFENPSMSAEAKRERLDHIYRGMVNAAREALRRPPLD